MKKIVLIQTLLFTLFIFQGCKKDKVSSQQSLTSNSFKGNSMMMAQSEVPYASEAELSKFNLLKDVIHYKVARYYAYAEIENALFNPLLIEPQSYRLSERPVIIYDFDSKPKYYEFSVLKEGLVYATITTIAKKEATNMVADIFNYPLDYKNKGGNDYIVAAYPAVFTGNASSPGQVPTNLVSFDKKVEAKVGSTNLIQTYQNLINQMDAESQADHATAISDLQTELAEINTGLTDFWQNADANKNRILGLSDDEILNEVKDGIYGKTTATTWDEYIIPAYGTENMKKTHWHGWCGPSAVAWAYRGIYSTYPRNTSSNYLRIHGDTYFNSFKYFASDRSYYDYYDDAVAGTNSANTDFSLYKKLWAHCTKTYGVGGPFYPMYIGGMRNAMKEVTDNIYTVNMTLYPHSRIRNEKLPVFTMIGFEGQLHYLVAFGSGYEKRKSGVIKSKFLLVTDDGAAISRHNYYPYWRNQSPDPGIRYKVEKK